MKIITFLATIATTVLPASAALADSTHELISCAWNPSAHIYWHVEIDTSTQQVLNFDGYLSCGDHGQYTFKLFDTSRGEVLQTTKFNRRKIAFEWTQNAPTYCDFGNPPSGVPYRGVLDRVDGTLMFYKQWPPGTGWSSATQTPLVCKLAKPGF